MSESRMCSVCKNDMVPSRVEYAYWHEDTVVALINGVPSWVCQLCGHRFYEPGVERTLSELVKDYIKLGKTFPIPSTPYRAAAA